MTPRIERALEEVRTVYLKSVFWGGSAKAGKIIFSMLILMLALDNLFALYSILRLFLLITFCMVSVFLLWKELLRPLMTDIPAETCAIILEKRCPDLDCRLINSLLLSQEKLSPLSGKVVKITVSEVEKRLHGFSFPSFFDKRKIIRSGLICLLSLFVLSGYGIIFPGYFGNAFKRYLAPFSVVPHINGAELIVSPQDVTVQPGSVIRVRAMFTGVLPGKAFIRKESSSFSMAFDGQAFIFTFPPVQKSFKYKVFSSSTSSPYFEVKVERPPSITDLRLRFDFPEYSGRPVRFEENSTGDVSCLKGTKVTVLAFFNKPVSTGEIVACGKASDLSVKTEKSVEGSFLVTSDGFYTLTATGKKYKLKGGGNREFKIHVVQDISPVALFVRPAPDARYRVGFPLKVGVRATDDLGVELSLLQVSESVNGPWRNACSWKGKKGRLILPGEAVLYPKNETLILRAIARDFLGQETVTDPLILKALTIEELREKELSRISNAARTLRLILELQVDLLKKTKLFYRGVDFKSVKIIALRDKQAVIVKESRELLILWTKTSFSADKRLKFEFVVKEDMAKVISLFTESLTAEKTLLPILKSLKIQNRIIASIKELLGELENLALEVKDFKPGELKNFSERVARRKEALESLNNQLDKFLKDQKDVIKSSEKLTGKRLDDFTSGELEKIDELKEQEEKWAGIIKAAAAEFARLGPQDFADSTLADELVEAYSEVELAADALESKKIEIAVPAEQAGAELAEEIKSNIERWLADVPDKIKWSMEDPVADVEVPMADLPDELEDLIGDLIDQEDEMTEDVEDVTSGWIDSLDEGAGWTAMDGPISNMSAKGVTGNLLPNQHEIGGRSGEGRSGKSHGQMVEKTASGKGGRPTPTRVTPDPFEAGQVKDSSTDPTSGSTGGGKLAGTAPEGLRGPVSPDLGEKLRGLKQKQSRIRSNAERMARRLHRLNITQENLKRSLELMKAMESFLSKGGPGNVSKLHERIVNSLRNLQSDVALRSGYQLENELVPEKILEGMENAESEDIPAPYEDLVKDYFEALARSKK